MWADVYADARARYNLVLGGVASPKGGAFAGAVVPWLVAWTTYTGHTTRELLR